MSIPRIATYRLQFRNGMTFDKAAKIVPYLKRLGISHLYASPIFTATGGSSHGYDIVDYNELDPALGGEAGFERLHAALEDARMGLVLDIVPNHMAASLENRWWRSVIEFGKSSPYATHFDIDWSRRLTLPILGRDYRDVLEAGELALEADYKNGCLALAYADNRLPLNPLSYRMIAGRLGDRARGLDGLADLSAVAGGADTFHDAVRTWLASDAALHLDDALLTLSGDASFIDRLHDAQPWRLTFWQEARRDLSYRRFFEVTGLVGVRVEDDPVFDDVHGLALSLVRAGKVHGLRVDHVDGLACPTSYLRRLRREAGSGTWILVEKILGKGERLPAEWADCATTGYEFIPAAAKLLVDPKGLRRLRRAYERFASTAVDRAGELRDAKLLVLTRNFEGELSALVSTAAGIARRGGTAIDDAATKRGIIEIILAFDVYRTYGEDGPLSAQDRTVLRRALRIASDREAADASALAFIGMLLESEPDDSGERDLRRFRRQFQQLTGPVMAKAVEDTLFYRLNPLISLNEVGCSPDPAVTGPEAFHEAMLARVGTPPGLVATGTHDTKRGEDARARLHALAERPDEWATAVGRWSRLNAHLKSWPTDEPLPEARVEWLLYQALAGVWPPGTGPGDAAAIRRLRERFVPYVEKALREAKLRTDWLDVDEGYEGAVRTFAEGLLDPANHRFLADFDATLCPCIEAGTINSLTQTLARLTVPGVPDLYQGSEGLDLSLVDPDNRRPVDFEALSAMLDASLIAPDPPADMAGAQVKQWMIARTLACRSVHPALFASGRYLPLRMRGKLAAYHPGYLREHDGLLGLVVLQRLPLRRREAAANADDTIVTMPPRCVGRRFRNVFTGSGFEAAPEVPLRTILADLPVALAVSSGR